MTDTTREELAFMAFKEAWNQKGSMEDMTPLEVRTCRQHFDEWWGGLDE